ncbi:DUF2505 domain-containing protein [Cellulomonas hominis]
MHLHVTLTLATDAPTAGRLLADPAYVHEKVAASGARDPQVDVVPGENGAFTVTVRRSLPTDQIPTNLRGFVGSHLDVRQIEAWGGPDPDGSRRGTVAVEIAGAPVRMTGTLALSPVAGPGGPSAATTITYDGELKASVPLFGGAVEDAAAGAIRSTLAQEEVVSGAWLASHPDAYRA